MANSLAEGVAELASAAEGSEPGFGVVPDALIGSAVFDTDCADADVAQAITDTKAKAVVQMLLSNRLRMPSDGGASMCS